MLLTRTALTSWTLANIVASAVFTFVASPTWLEPQLRGVGAAQAGDAFVWFIGAFPVLAISAIANAVWLAFVSRELRRNGGTWPVPSLTVIAAIWISALVVDHLRGMGF